jgi:hypothetical protein
LAARWLEVLEEERQELARRAAIAQSPRRDVLEGLLGVRRLAAELIGAGESAGPAGSAAIVAGFTLMRGRDGLDAALGELLELASPQPPQEPRSARLEEALQHVQRFVAGLDAGPGPSTDPEVLDSAVALATRPLLRALTALAAGGGAADHWLAAPGSTDSLEADLSRLRARLAAAPPPPSVLQPINRVVSYLKRGSTYDDLRPRVLEYAAEMSAALDLQESLARAAWLPADRRDALENRLGDALRGFGDPATRTAAREALRRLASTGAVIDRITVLEQRQSAELRELRAVVLDRLAAEGNEPLSSAERLVQILDRMIAYRELVEPELSGELRAVRRRLDESCRKAERALLERIAAVLENPGALADPALSSLVSSHRDAIGDLERLDRVPQWTATFALLRPAAANGFSTKLRRLCTELLDQSRRPDAAAQLERLGRQVERFGQLPYEDRIRRGDAVAVTGGMDRQLAAAIDGARGAWADGAALGESDGEAAVRLELIYRLAAAMADTADVPGGAEAAILNRWAAWEIDPSTSARLLGDLPGRFKLATAAAVDGQLEELRRQVERIEREAPPARLVGRLHTALAPRLEALPDGALGTAAQLAGPQPRAAHLAEARGSIAGFCRYAMELDYARIVGDEELAGRLQSHLNALSMELLR